MVFSHNSSALVFGSADQEMAAVVPIDSSDVVRVACEAVPKYKLLVGLLPNQDSTGVVQSCKVGAGRVSGDIKEGVFVADQLA